MLPLEIVKSFYDAIAKGDVAAVPAVLQHDLIWTKAEGFPFFSGTWRTPQVVVDNRLVPLARE